VFHKGPAPVGAMPALLNGPYQVKAIFVLMVVYAMSR